ncbi:MAG: alpha-N-arabinofuranosidase [candidate division KSB1 bacterium]|nr:alpha-N-arabinofuranosidase [candidate division KSB1 bacterium]
MKRIPLVLLLTACLYGQASITIDLNQKSEPIQPYIYGQFIEHLGRCIYGGLWAEMLEDRKFYYPITDDYKPFATSRDDFWKAGDYQYLAASPWKVIGPAGSVKMDVSEPYVGEHSPVIFLPGNGTAAGIAQPELAVRKGKRYVGRIVLAGSPTAAPITVRLVSHDGMTVSQTIPSLTLNYKTYPLTFKPNFSCDHATLEIFSTGAGSFKIGTVSLMPDDNIHGWRRDVIALLKELNSPVYRWPGGNFVSGYNWRDGIGPRDKRPPRKNPAWKGVEHNDVGIHEYMQLMELIGAEPFVSVNTGLGTVEEVAEEVEYINGDVSTPMGKLRAQNGHPQPWRCRFWAVGNEMYGEWQLGHMPLEQYVEKHNRVAEAMWKVDPTIKLIGVGEVGRWSETMLRVCGDYMNLISEHIYCKDLDDVPAHVRQLADQIRYKADAHRRYRREIPGLLEKDIRISMDEWNYWYGDYIYGELGVRYHLKDALGVAVGLHEYYRNSDLFFMANYAQTVNVIGCIKTTRTDAAFDATGLPLVLYRREFGTIPLKLEGETGSLDAAAALTDDGRTLTVSFVNPTPQTTKVRLDLLGGKLGSKAVRYVIRHDDPMAYNEPGKPPVLTIKQNKVKVAQSLEVPAYAIALYRLPIKP